MAILDLRESEGRGCGGEREGGREGGGGEQARVRTASTLSTHTSTSNFEIASSTHRRIQHRVALCTVNPSIAV